MGRLLAFVLQYRLGYRRKVVQNNLLRVFGEKTVQERQAIERGFYRYLGGLLWDLLTSLRRSGDDLIHKIQLENPEVLRKASADHRSVVLLTSHFGNWEWIARRLAAERLVQFWFVYKPLGRPWAERWLRRWRERQGLVPVPIKEVRPRLKEFFENDSLATPVALYLGADQSPTPHSRWIVGTFLGQRTLMYQGPEELSRAYGLRPVYVGIEPLEGGKYRVRLEEAPQGWELEPSGFLMQWYMDRLSQQIFRAPSFWLWSHRRWKLEGLETQTPTT
ncbi:MAG: lysophospholipid acyltransferase family protein [Bacteroidia bacterium]